MDNQIKTISIKWGTMDIILKAKDLGYEDLSITQANTILDTIERNHDATIGINWDVIDFNIQNYFDNQTTK